jgi:hypothetical protein
MKARALIEGATYDPQKMKVLYKGFVQAWEQIAPAVGTNADAIEAARLKLANIVLGLAEEDSLTDADALAKDALDMMHQSPTKL